ncbi:hypothetical protein [Hoeflea alexandrii]|uniref:hypothetical protein n=1 Tax=Hoeflea alexandrii TaxID=288436 RepID=UPI002D1E38F4|nr:hypothetical protein [Hoeflea alexandrii]
MASQQKIIVITAGGAYAWVIVNALASRFENLEVVLEQPESKSLFLKRRARKIGWLQTVLPVRHDGHFTFRQALCRETDA